MNAITAAGALFDYASLDEPTRHDVQERTGKIRTLIRRSAQDIIDIGNELLAVKGALGHGSFGHWLAGEFTWSVDTAERFMNVARRFEQIPHGAEFQSKALYLLAKESTPEEARTEALRLAAEGKPVSFQLAQSLVQMHTEARSNALAAMLEKSSAPVIQCAGRLAVDSAEKVEILERLYQSGQQPGSNGTFAEIEASGGFSYGEQLERWCDFVEASVTEINKGLRSLADQKRPENERRIPGAVKVGSRYRGEWKIPRAVAENWKRDGRGRKPSKDNADQHEAEQDFKDGWKAAMNDDVIPASDLKWFLDDDD